MKSVCNFASALYKLPHRTRHRPCFIGLWATFQLELFLLKQCCLISRDNVGTKDGRGDAGSVRIAFYWNREIHPQRGWRGMAAAENVNLYQLLLTCNIQHASCNMQHITCTPPALVRSEKLIYMVEGCYLMKVIYVSECIYGIQISLNIFVQVQSN